MDLQHRAFDLNFELRQDKENEGIIEGYASIFGVVDLYQTTFEKGAFVRSLAENGNPAFLLHHDSTRPVGNIVEVYEDDRGLRFKAELNTDIQDGKEAFSMAKKKNIRGISFGFVPRKWEDSDDDSGIRRRFTDVDIMEISMVTFPANKQAQIAAVRAELPQDIRSFEHMLIEIGYSRSEAKKLASGGFKYAFNEQEDSESNQRDDDKGEEKTEQSQRDVDYSEVIGSLNNLINKIKGI